VAFLASFSSPAVIFEQISVIFALPKLFIASFTLVLPFFPTGSFERVEEEGDVATAFTLARILSMIPKSRGGPTSVVIYDIHALQERFYFGDDVLPCFETGIPLLLQRLRQLPDAENVRSGLHYCANKLFFWGINSYCSPDRCQVACRSPLPFQMMEPGSGSTSCCSTFQWSAIPFSCLEMSIFCFA